MLSFRLFFVQIDDMKIISCTRWDSNALLGRIKYPNVHIFVKNAQDGHRFLRYCVGVLPFFSRNRRIKLYSLEYPQRSAISRTLSVVDDSRRLAWFILLHIMSCFTFTPNIFL